LLHRFQDIDKLRRKKYMSLFFVPIRQVLQILPLNENGRPHVKLALIQRSLRSFLCEDLGVPDWLVPEGRRGEESPHPEYEGQCDISRKPEPVKGLVPLQALVQGCYKGATEVVPQTQKSWLASYFYSI
jgi:hypothetical protein